MTDPAIETNELTKQFGDVTAVDGIDLTVERGEIFGFLGPNGAGKSTTINVLLDFVKPTTGTASMLGLDVSEDREALHGRIGVVPENYGLYDRLSGRRHVELAIELKEAADDPNELLDRVGLSTDDANRSAGEYSTGMSQRLALAMALVGSPELLILDEPTSGLDPNGARELRELIRDENERGATVFFSSHILEQVEAASDRVGIMNDGQVVATDTIDRLRGQLDTGAQVALEVNREPDQKLDDLPNVRDVVVADGVVRGTCLEPAAKLQFIDRVREVTTVTDVRIEESSLEDLFASYTNEETSNSHGEPVAPGGVA
ncbi:MULTISPECIES: ABC transporter ATP-binding protein [Halorubrum]|uniref:ABC transporter n=1 Tax=Halorubrum hochstenium ATCC 700873 TaxID=1227481 RepID=M0FNX2_9EURY|nr:MULTISPECIES: ABC transporter ATP-binding protein [Halorubrum]ELZ60978.1 ABC transporter [Halorubrum hochstenium ATCC 700873]